MARKKKNPFILIKESELSFDYYGYEKSMIYRRTLAPKKDKKKAKKLEAEIQKLESLGKSAIIITSPIVRMYFKKLTEDYFKDLVVVSYNEVESNVELQSVGMVTA